MLNTAPVYRGRDVAQIAANDALACCSLAGVTAVSASCLAGAVCKAPLRPPLVDRCVLGTMRTR